MLTTEKLRYMQENLRDLMEVAPVVVYMLSSDGKITFLSPKFEEITGWSRKEWLNKSFEALIHPEDLPLAKETFKRVLEGERPPPYELRVLSKSGEYIVGEFTSIPITENGKVIGEFGVVQNITEKKRAESALKEREELFRSIVENSHNAIIIVDENFKITYANNEATVLSGYKKEEIIGQDFRKVLAEEDKSLVEERYILRQKGKQVPPKYEFKIIRKDGEKRDVELRATIIRDKNGKVCTIAQLLDITDRKRFEESLSALHAYGQNLTMAKNMKEIYKLTLDALTKTSTFEYASIFIMEGKNLRLAAHRGYPKSQKLVIPLNDGMEIVTKAARTGESINIPDIRKEKAYAKTRKGILSELAVPIKIGNMVLGVLDVGSRRLAAFGNDDRKKLEVLASYVAIAISNIKRHESLTTLSKKLEYLIKSSTKIMQIENMRKRLKEIAKTIQKFGWGKVTISLRDENLNLKDIVAAGLTKEEMKVITKQRVPGYVWKELLGPQFEKFKIGEFYYLSRNDPQVPKKVFTEYLIAYYTEAQLYAPIRTPDGKIVGILTMGNPVDARKPTRETLMPIELFLHHAAITLEKAQLIENLEEARKELKLYADELEKKVEERTRALKESQEKLLKAQRLAAIGELAGIVGHDLRNPLTSMTAAAYYLKKQLAQKCEGKIGEMIELIEKNINYSNKIISDLLDYSREIKLELVKTSPQALVEESLSLLEIPKNVRVVKQVKGNLEIRVDAEKMKRVFTNLIKNAIEAMPNGGTLTIKSKKIDDKITFAFSDTGIGMSEEVLKQLWNPLFTTKAKGIGLGLAICKRFVEAHGGSISVESAPGKGTTFTVKIPIEPKMEEVGEKIWVKQLESSSLTTTKA